MIALHDDPPPRAEHPMSLKKLILDSIPPEKYWQSEFPDVKFSGGRDEDVWCCFHEERKGASLSVNPKTGKWYCHTCERGGSSILSFHAERYGLQSPKAATELFDKFIHPTVSEKLVRKYHRALLATPSAMGYITQQRLVPVDTIKRFSLGWDGNRVTFPVYNEYGLCVNIRYYDPLAKKHNRPKIVNHHEKGSDRSYGSPVMLWPLDVLYGARRAGEPILVCEGEFDCMVLNGMGIPAVTSTSGSKSWPAQYNHLFADLDVVLCYDTDVPDKRGRKPGEDGESKVTEALRNVALSIKKITVPNTTLKDVTGWARKVPVMRTRKGWVKEIRNAKVVVDHGNNSGKRGDAKGGIPGNVHLAQASEAQYYNKRVTIKALCTGKDIAPYILPKKYTVSCGKSEPCDHCPLAVVGKKSLEKEIDPSDPKILKLIDASDTNMSTTLLEEAGINPMCGGKVDVEEAFNVEQLILTPSLDTGGDGTYVMRTAYFTGHGTSPNRAYNFTGVTVPHPKDQHSTHLFTDRQPVKDDIETFKVSPDLVKQLAIFRPKKLNLLAHLMSIAEWQSKHITKIRDRPDLHIAVDLFYHSVAGLNFNDETIPRGMLDVLIIGDTRCGKGYVAERLNKFYGLGEVASGENCSFAGLVGGLQQVGKRWIVTWGLIPLNHNRAVIIDETSSMTEKSIGDMSRVRSEGVAEINKIMREQALASTRLLWLSNPRSGQAIMGGKYNAGVEAIKELVGANEDVSRFDFAMTVATNEVDPEVINAPSHYDTTDLGKYPPDLCRKLVLWAWSRTKEQIQFTAKASTAVINLAIELGREYSPTIPLVQAENIRIKIAKIAAAVAARVFSSDEKGENLIIKEEHVKFVGTFLRMLYEKPSMGYGHYSRTSMAGQRIVAESDITTVFRGLHDDAGPTASGLLELNTIDPSNLADYVGDTIAAKTLIGELVRLRCIARDKYGYIKNPTFTAWLRKNLPEIKSLTTRKKHG